MSRRDTGELQNILSPAYLDQLFKTCPICNYPYVTSFAGSEFMLTEQPVCGGNPELQMCLPTLYMCFSVPLSSMKVEVERDGVAYRGIVYAVSGQERIDDDG